MSVIDLFAELSHAGKVEVLARQRLKAAAWGDLSCATLSAASELAIVTGEDAPLPQPPKARRQRRYEPGEIFEAAAAAATDIAAASDIEILTTAAFIAVRPVWERFEKWGDREVGIVFELTLLRQWTALERLVGAPIDKLGDRLREVCAREHEPSIALIEGARDELLSDPRQRRVDVVDRLTAGIGR